MKPSPWLRKGSRCQVYLGGEWRSGICAERWHRRTRLFNGESFIVEYGATVELTDRKGSPFGLWSGSVGAVRRPKGPAVKGARV